MKKGKQIKLVLNIMLLSLVFAENAAAYLDPGTGSYIFQLLIAAFFGALFAIKVFWTKIKLFFSNLSAKFKK